MEQSGLTGPLTLAGRLLTAAALGVMAGVHLQLYSTYSYKSIHVIGPLFLINGIVGSGLCLAVLGAPKRLLGLTALACVGMLLGTLAGFVYALNAPLFGFQDSIHAPFAWTALIDESVGTVIAAVLAVAVLRGQSIRSAVAIRRRA